MSAHQQKTPIATAANELNVPCRSHYEDDEIDLFELWNVIWAARIFIVLFTFVCTLIAVVVVVQMPNIYQSQAVLSVPSTGSSAMGSLGRLAGSLPFSLGLPSSGGTGQKLIDFLSSSNLKQRLIEKYELLPRLYKDGWDPINKKWLEDDPKAQPSVVKALQGGTFNSIYTVAQNDKSGLITIKWTDEDPKFAATMLERVIGELDHYLNFEYETDAKLERLFVEQQVEKATADLLHWEKQLPTATLTQNVISRERLVTQTVYQELRKQLELAKINEAKQLVSFKVLDAPFVPELKFKPKRSMICVLVLCMSGFMAVIITFIRYALKQHRSKGEDNADLIADKV